MRAAELNEYSTTSKKIDRILKAKGYKRLGAGVDQTAYLEPGTGFVLKVFGTQGGETFSQDHKMFFAWAKYCMKNSNNPFLPRFGGYESFILDGDRYLQIRQEALQPIGVMGRLLDLIAQSIEEDGVRHLDDAEDYIADYGLDTDLKNFEKLRKQLGDKGFNLLFSTMLKLHAISQKQGWGFDLHAGNFMRRADGTPVIVDPWVVFE